MKDSDIYLFINIQIMINMLQALK